jgi:predicted KAP-like P-loop ATPase
MTIGNDTPIEQPESDVYGLDPFARAVARSIDAMSAPSGVVLAINGPWGSGKSSSINLIRYHLKKSIADKKISLVEFNPWWFSDSESLTFSFFQQLESEIGPTLSDRAKSAFRGLARGISSTGQIVGALADIKAPGIGTLISGITSLVGRAGEKRKSIESEHATLVEALKDQNRKFLIIIDDIDRLSPDDAITVFRLVKSVGRLPNVIYLLAFDRTLAEKAVRERFPSEGRSYLDKIVQSSFDIPPPTNDLLRAQLLRSAFSIMGHPPATDSGRFMNVFFDVVAPCINGSRDVIRIVNDLSATWPAVADEVDRADFLSMASLRLARPEIHQAIKDNIELLIGIESNHRDSRSTSSRYDRIFKIDTFDNVEQLKWRSALRRLFPRLDSIWSNIIHSDTSSWDRDRRICSRRHHKTYFQYSISHDILPIEDVRRFILGAKDVDFVVETLSRYAGQIRPLGGTRAALMLEELSCHASEIAPENIAPLVAGLLRVADIIDVDEDAAKGFPIARNKLRIHWLLNILVQDRLPIEEREKIYHSAISHASLAWICDFAHRCMRPFEPRTDGRQPPDPIVSEEAAIQFKARALESIRAASQNGMLIKNRNFASLLFDWARSAGEDDVRQWVKGQIDNIEFAVALAQAMTTIGYQQGLGLDGLGDRVAKPIIRVRTKPYQDFVDVEKFVIIVKELLSGSEIDET